MDFEKEKQLMKILARNSSVGCSSRIFYYYGSGEGVPFNWEMKPGIAKDPLPKEELPPLSPPPALVSLGLPKPCIHEHPNPSTAWSRLRRRLCKRIMKENRKRSSLPECTKNDADDDHVKNDLDVFERFLECSSDFESFASPRDSSCSSSSSSSSPSPCHLAMQETRSGCSAGEAFGLRPSSCIPIHFPKTLIPIMKRD